MSELIIPLCILVSFLSLIMLFKSEISKLLRKLTCNHDWIVEDEWWYEKEKKEETGKTVKIHVVKQRLGCRHCGKIDITPPIELGRKNKF